MPTRYKVDENESNYSLNFISRFLPQNKDDAEAPFDGNAFTRKRKLPLAITLALMINLVRPGKRFGYQEVITQHIPEKSFQLVRYYGWYSNRARGEREKLKQQEKPVKCEEALLEIIDISDYRPRRIPSPKWRECIKKVWEVDPLICPKCGSEMRIISFITENEVIRKILEHLDLW